jgi:hypothetical protein
MALALPEEIVLTALHETRHAYQRANIDFPQFFVGKETEETINRWKKDFENYNKPHEHYLSDNASQTIEKDATEFAWNFISKYINEDKEIS